METRIVTIDGPAGAGKTTVSKRVASRLGCIYVDTGSLYRAVAFEVLESGIEWQKTDQLEALLQNLSIELVMGRDSLAVKSSGIDITDHLRTTDISMLASAVSAKPEVRLFLLDTQRRIAEQGDAVFEGRDMGTVVFPRAQSKFFLFADLKIRALRRYNELPSNSQHLSQVESAMALRDYNDVNRLEAPLKPADDAILIDSSLLTLDQVVALILSHIPWAHHKNQQ
ncbi:MAG: (d)CMP kinase [Pseudomonadota bacterium]